MMNQAIVDAWPLIVPADETSTIHLIPAGSEWHWRQDVPYCVTVYPVEERGQAPGWLEHNTVVVRAQGDDLAIPWHFAGEQEHVLLIRDNGPDGPTMPTIDVRVYSLEPDLFHRRPYKGDVHTHSRRSDGRELPAHVAAEGRRIGLDFLAVTDHRLFAPSLEALAAYEGVPLDMALFSGEEIHPPDNPVHIIHFGGARSVNALFSEPRYRSEVQALMAEVERGGLADADLYQYASCLWCFREIARVGGLSMFCHPYWFTQHRYAPSGPLTDRLLREQPFDAFELIGGYWLNELDSNKLQVARYHELRGEGFDLPILGVSDAHGCSRGLFGWYYTLVLAESPVLGDLRAAVRDHYALAVEALPGETVRPVGPFRMVKYALFLLAHILSQHDTLCTREGNLMLHHIEGDPAAKDTLAILEGQTEALYDRLWADA